MIDCTKTENYFIEKRRMTKRTANGLCKLGCSNCPLYSRSNNKGLTCTDFEAFYPEKAIKIVQKWSDEHPRKTYLSEFLKNYPNAWLNEKGIPKRMCPSMLGLKDLEDCGERNCVECWNQPVEDGEE